MKRTLQTLLFALIAIMMPIVAWAQETTVQAKWGASADALTNQGTLAEAFSAAAADGSTVGYIQLQADVATTEENRLAIIGGEFTLDLKGHTLSSDNYSVLEIYYSGTHVTITGEGNMTCTASGYPTVALSEEASLTIASGTFTSTGYVVFQTYGNLVIEGGTFTAADGFNTINYVAGTVDLSEYSDVTGISIENYSEASVAPGAIALPSGYCFYDTDNSPVTELQPGETYTIGVVQAKWGASADALTFEGTLAEAFNEAAADGSTVGYIQLQTDVAATQEIDGGEFTLDLNGHTLSSDDNYPLEISNSGTHVTLIGEAEGSKVTCTASGCSAVLAHTGASVTIASGSYESGHYVVNIYNASASVTIQGGTFTSTGDAVFQTYGNLVIEGGTFTAADGFNTIKYVAGTVDLSNYSGVTGISIGNYSEASVTPGTIALPSGYCFYDSNNLPVTELQSGEIYTIGVWAEETTVQAKWGASVNALTNQGTLAAAFSAAAAADGSTVGYIQLQTDVAATQDNQLLIDGGEFTLDLNGHTLSSDDYNVLIIYSGTHVTITGEGNMTCTASDYYSTVVLSEEASLTIASGIFTSTGYVVFQTSGNLVINGGTFTAADGYNTINYVAGTVDLSHYSDVTGISIRKNSGASVASSTITLPSGYCFYDSNSSAVTELQPGETYTIGEEPEQKYTVTFDAGGGEGTMENGISYGGDYMLPECAFTAPEGKMFKAWQVGESEQQPGAIVDITGNTTVTALWRDYVPQITINMYDSYGDGWSGNTIIVKKNGEQIGTATIASSSNSNTVRYDYDSSVEYTFYWQLGEADNTYLYECSFEILVEDEVVFTAERYDNDNTSDCENYTDGQLIHTIAGVPIEVETLTIADGALEVYSNNAALTTVGTLTYTRTLPNREWNALYVPFEIPVSQLTDSYDVAYINDVHSYDNDEDGTIDELKMEVIHITAGTLNANYPYLIRAKNDKAMTMNLVITDAALYATKVNTVTCSSVFMKFDVTGTYAQMTADDLTDEEDNTSLVITTDGSWKQLAAESTLNPFRLYLTMTAIDGSPVKVAPEAARSMRIVTRGETTRIENSELKTETPADVYDLQGRRVENPTKGIYIVNGKKVVLK